MPRSLLAGLVGAWRRTDRVLLGILAVALALRVTAAVGLHLISVAQGGDGFWGFAGDAITYEQFGLRQAAGWREQGLGPVEGVAYTSWYVVFLGGIYWAFGEAGRAVAVGVNILAGVAAVGLVWSLAGRLAGRRAAVAAAVLVAIFPTHVLWSTQLLKDPLVVTLALAALSAGLAINGRGWRQAALEFTALLALTTLLTGFRPYTAITVAAALLVHAGVTVIATRRVLPLVTVAIAAAVAPLAAGKGVFWSQWVAQVDGVELGLIRDEVYQVGGAAVAYPPCPDISALELIAACLPAALAFGLFEPLPARWLISPGAIERLVGIQLAPWYLLVVLSAAGTLLAARRGHTRPSALALGAYVAGYATALGVVIANYGALVRLRAPFEPVVVILAAIALAALIGRLRGEERP